jgi:Protein of unknown function (DUF3592)
MSLWQRWMSKLERRYWARTGMAPPGESEGTSYEDSESLRHMRLFLWPCAVGATILAGVVTFYEIQLAWQGTETTATVVDRGTDREGLYADVVFTTQDGRRVRASIPSERWGNSIPDVGERVRVKYVPSDPAYSVNDAERLEIQRFVFPALFGVAAVFFTALAFSTRPRRKCSNVQ